ncbi:hypothetical protein [Sphingomonas oligophenolica]|uniref:Lipoprotein n=1 Tax=Sphingomonas oligophenolica TaxID=301154 RepID=A0A502CN28_9SPHN|nr:hypothetical protein [Sphingomonas oligophenolica]TPG13549.1 hypothetical protein EAH84_04955 [Sphingomonas oligophenolica]
MKTIPIVAGLLLLTACNKHDAVADNDQTATAAFVPPKTQAPAPLPGQAHQVPLAAYIGKYPTDTVGGVTFFDRTEVANALIAAVGDDKLRRMITARDGVTVPIFAYQNKIAAHGCEPHNCSAHSWTFVMNPDASGAVACFHDEAAMGDTSRWVANDEPVTRPGDCPQA